MSDLLEAGDTVIAENALDKRAEEVVKIFKDAGMIIELGANFSVKGQIAQLLNGSKALQAECEKLRKDADMKELLKDKARLDWLADVNQTVGSVLLPTDIVERNLSSLRDALDEAMLIESTRG